jgi:flagellar hook-basal body complex protein FliE
LQAAGRGATVNLPLIVIQGDVEINGMDIKGLDQILGQMRTAAAFAGGGAARVGNVAAGGATGAKAPDFATTLKASLDHVNGMQEAATQKARNFELGGADSSLQDVMVSIQKASISFQQTVQVRNKLVSAYHDIMNMQI